MSNIILTTTCQRRCKYCFAKNTSETSLYFSDENFDKVLHWLLPDTSLVQRVALLGGEPTLHPNFTNFLDKLLTSNLKTVIFTNGMITNSDLFNSIINIAYKHNITSANQLGFCINVNEKKYRTTKEDILQDMFLKKLGKVSCISFNIFEETFNPYFLIDIVKKYKTMPAIRLGLAMPIKNNEYLKINSYVEVAPKIVKFITEATKNNITVGFDCGFIKCMFTEEEIKKLHSLKIDTLTFDCSPTVDIYPDLKISNCYPLAIDEKINMYDYKSYTDVYLYFKNKLSNSEPIFDKCNSCDYFISGSCSGGCKAYKINNG